VVLWTAAVEGADDTRASLRRWLLLVVQGIWLVLRAKVMLEGLAGRFHVKRAGNGFT
jgi:hypothetical protein